MDVFSFHAVNVFLHGIASVLVLLTARKLLSNAEETFLSQETLVHSKNQTTLAHGLLKRSHGAESGVEGSKVNTDDVGNCATPC